MYLSIENNNEPPKQRSHSELVEEAIRQSNERRERRRQHYNAYLTKDLPKQIQQSSIKQFFRQAHYNQHLKALDINIEQPDNNQKINTLSSIMNTSCGLAYLGLHIDELIRIHANKLSPISSAVALSWNAINIIINIAIIRQLFKQKLYGQAAAMSASTGLLSTVTISNFLTLHSIHVIQGAAAASVGAFGYFAFSTCSMIAFGMELGHVHGAKKRQSFYESQLTIKTEDLSKANEKLNNQNTRDDLETEIVALTNLIHQEKAFIREHKKCATVYGCASLGLLGLSSVGLLTTLGVITGIAASVVSMGVVPAALAALSISVVLWSYFHRAKQANVVSPTAAKSLNTQSATTRTTVTKMANNKSRLFTPDKHARHTPQDQTPANRPVLVEPMGAALVAA